MYNANMNATVVKRDGSKEIFNRDKVCGVLMAAGLPQDQAEGITNTVESWIQSNNLEEFKSLELRDKILEELTKVNKEVADLYQWYESTKDKKA